MPKRSKELSAIEVKRLKESGFHAVGGVPGLHLRINDGDGKSWVLRATVKSKRRDIGLGGYPDVSLATAREIARTMREQIQTGVDPVEERAVGRRKEAEDQKPILTFGEVVERYLTSGKLDGLSNAKHRAQWRSTLTTYAVSAIGHMPIDDIDVNDILTVLEPIWLTKHETARRLRSRIESVFSWAKVQKLRSGDNPATWSGNLKELLAAPNKVKVHYPAVSISDAPTWFSTLKTCKGMAAKALEFLTLTAARSGEIRMATWSEINLEDALWVVPAARMKMRREHRVPLSRPALELLKALPRMEGSELLFPSPQNMTMSDMSLSAVMRRMHASAVKNGGLGWLDPVQHEPAVPHGLRSTFRDWIAEKTDYPADLAEVALAHKVGSAVERAYRRGDMLEKRRQMMEDWVAFLTTTGATTTSDTDAIQPVADDTTTNPLTHSTIPLPSRPDAT